MRAPEFSFRHEWRVEAPADRVAEVLVDLEHYPDWWRQVVAVAKIDDDTARVLCRSRLPYTLDLVLTAVRREARLLETTIGGQLVGSARWRLTEEDGATRASYEQDVVVRGRALAFGARLARPLLGWNHARMMCDGEAGLRRWMTGQP